MEKYFDTPTFILYIVLGLITSFMLTYAEKQVVYINSKKKYRQIGNITYGAIFAILVFFATFRESGTYTFGGADAFTYILRFYQMPSFSIQNLVTFTNIPGFTNEPVLFIIFSIIKIFTSNYHIMFFIVYSIIVYGYLRFLRQYYINSIFVFPVILLINLYLNGYCVIRNALAIGIAMLAYSYLNDNNRKFIIYLIIAFLTHNSLLILIIFEMFRFLTKDKSVWNKSVYAILSFMLLTIIKPILMNLEYFNRLVIYSDNLNSLIGQLPILILFTLIVFINNDCSDKKICQDASIFNIAVLPLMLSYGFFRLSDILMLFNIISWGMVLNNITKYFRCNNRIYLYAMFYFIFFMYFVYRILQDWHSFGIMPYMFDL